MSFLRHSKMVAPVVVGLAIVSVVAVAWGVGMLLSRRRLPSGERSACTMGKPVRDLHRRHNKFVRFRGASALDRIKSF